MTGEYFSEFERSIMGLDYSERFEVLRKELWEHDAEPLFRMMTPYCSSRGVFPLINLTSFSDYVEAMEAADFKYIDEDFEYLELRCKAMGIRPENAFIDGYLDIVEHESAIQHVYDYIDEFANILLEFGPRDPLTGSIEELLDFWEREDDGEL